MKPRFFITGTLNAYLAFLTWLYIGEAGRPLALMFSLFTLLWAADGIADALREGKP